jgi:YbbR domain-containing protein
MDQKNTWLIKICCVIAAFSLWLYIINETNTQTTQPVQVPVELTNIEYVNSKGYTLLPGQQFEVSLRVKGSTADIASGKSQFKVVADMSLYAVTKGENRIPIIVERQPVNVNVLNSEALYVKVVLDELAKKNFPVKVNLSGKTKEGYYSFAQSIAPTEVEVSGAARYVNQVASIEAKSDMKGTDKDLNMRLPLRALDAAGKEIKDVTISPDTVEVVVPVKKTKTVGINVVTKGVTAKNYHYKSLVSTPDKVDIAGDEAVINSITTLDTEPIDLSTLTPNKTLIAKIVIPPASGITLINSDGTVKLKANLDNIVEKTFIGDIRLKNINEGYTVTLDNSKLSIVVSGPESILETLKNDDFIYTIDASTLTVEGDTSITIGGIKLPEGVTKVSSSPQSVRASIKKKPAEPASPTTTPPTTPNTSANGGQ